MSKRETAPSLSECLARMAGRKSPFEMAPAELLDRAAEYRAMAVNAPEPEHAALERIAENYETIAAARRAEQDHRTGGAAASG